MRDAIFILVVAAVLLGLTAIRYRRQIVAAIAFWKQLQAAREQIRQPGDMRTVESKNTGIKLVNCARCGKWVPEDQARRHSSTTFVCATECRSKR